MTWRASCLRPCVLPESDLQFAEDLEQNKVIEAGFRIKAGLIRCSPCHSHRLPPATAK